LFWAWLKVLQVEGPGPPYPDSFIRIPRGIKTEIGFRYFRGRDRVRGVGVKGIRRMAWVFGRRRMAVFGAWQGVMRATGVRRKRMAVFGAWDIGAHWPVL